MGELAVREAEALTERQGAFVASYLENGSVSAASAAAGYADETAGRAALRSGKVQAALKEARRRVLEVEAAGEAVATMRELMKPGIPPAVRLGAAKWVLEAAGHGSKDQDDGKDKPLHEMTEAELQRFMARAQRVVDDGGVAPIIHVVPDNGALPALPDPGDV